jgi:uncharacterized integral membrane protein (TIGR00698 family)
LLPNAVPCLFRYRRSVSRGFIVVISRQQLSQAALALSRAAPGLALCGALAVLANTMASLVGTGVVWALLIGVAIATVWPPHPTFIPGIDATAKHVLRLGVALLGTQISADTLHVLDPATIMAIVGLVMMILLTGWVLAPMLGLDQELALITASSVAICGASAAVAFGLVLAPARTRERDVACTVGAVSMLSMLAMLVYPLLARVLGFDPTAAGIFLGATIQEVPHAVAAGYAMGDVSGTIATITKLLRVALLGPALMLVMGARSGSTGRAAVSMLRPPLFLVVFVLLAALNASGLLPRLVEADAGALSRFCIVAAMAAIGLKLHWRSLATYGWRPVLMLCLLSALLLALVASFLAFARS